MIIIGNKNKITKQEKELLKTKVKSLHLVDISNHIDEDTIDHIKNMIEKEEIKFIVLNLEKNISLKLKSYLEELDYSGIKIYIFSTFTQKFLDRKYIEFNEKDFEVYNSIHYGIDKKVTKRVFDFFFSIFSIFILSPIFIIIALYIKIKSPQGPILFTQRRLGLNHSYFRVYKFRTMIPNAEKVLKDLLDKDEKIREEYLTYRKLQNDPRIIPGIGNFLRKTSLDELPQFFNVLLGDMSIVGPRPYIEDEFYSHDSKFKKVILSMKPGVTGFWQVGDRHNDTFENRVEKDLEYILLQSFLLDIKIILKTIIVMLFKKGI